MRAARRVTVALLLAFAAGAQTPAADRLQLGRSIDREIHGGDTHTYTIELAAGQYIYLTAAQHGIDLILALSAPGGKDLVAVNRIPGAEGAEDIPWISSAAGEYRLAVKAANQDQPGRYELEIAALRPPSSVDSSRFQAFRATWIDAPALRAQNTADSLRRAAAKYEESLPLWRAAGDVQWEAHASHELGRILNALGQSSQAREYLLAALALRRKAGERLGLSDTLNSLALSFHETGDSRRAQSYFEEALDIRRALGDRNGEGVILNNLGLTYERTGDRPKALDYFNRSLAIRREIGDHLGESYTLSNLATVYRNSGQLEKALEHDATALTLRREVGDRRGIGTSLNGIGVDYYSLGETAKALEYWKQAEAEFIAIGDKRGLASLLGRLGSASHQLGRHRESAGYHERALALRRETGSKQGEINELISLARPLIALGEWRQAMETSRQALTLSRQTESVGSVGQSLANLGSIYAARGDPAQARENLLQAAAVFRGMGNCDLLSSALTALAGVEADAGNLREALARVEEAVNIAESQRTGMENPDLRASLRAARSDRYSVQLDILMRLHAADPAAGFDSRALEASERWRSRSLLEMLADSHIDPRQELTEEQRRREDDILKRTRAIQQEFLRADLAPARKRELDARLAAAERDLELYRLELRRAGSRYASAEYAETLPPERIRGELLAPDAALLEFALGDKRSFGWVVTAAGVAGAPLPARSEIEQLVSAYRQELSQKVTTLTAGAALARLDNQGRRLYELLISPFAKQMAGCRKLIVVPDGALAYLPFETLPGEKRLIERFSIGYAPSASTLLALRDRARQSAARPRTLLAFADPLYTTREKPAPALAAYAERGFDFAGLPNTRAEAIAIRSLFGPRETRVYLGAEASERLVKQEPLADYRFVHFAAHGYFDEERPARSGIVLSPGAGSGEDGVLQVSEIMALHLNADLVTLSACQTGLGKVLAGEGVLGLTRAFLYAGANSVVVSLWNVNDSATAELMKAFYRNLSRGISREEALRQAKLSLLHGPQSAWRHPYYWGPFIFVGDPGSSAAPVK